METKAFNGEPLEVSESRTVTGYLASFGDVDSDGDIIQKGAFTKTLAESWKNGRTRIKYLLDHKTDNVVGVFTKLEEDDKGLFYEAKIATHTKGEDYYRMVKDGVVDQHSIGFYTLQHKKEGKHRVITEVKLIEGSGIQFRAANYNTPITSVKSEQEVFDMISKLEYALKNGSYSDETMKELKSQLDIIMAIKWPKEEPSIDTSLLLPMMIVDKINF